MSNKDIDPNLLPGPRESSVLPEAERQRRPVFNPLGRVEQINANETKIADVRRHPIGLFFLYLQIMLALGLAFFFIFYFMPSLTSSLGVNSGTGQSVAVLIALIASLFAVVYLILATKIYQTSQLIITDDNVTQVMQVGLFHRKVSEVSMENIEDVTASQRGVLQTFFNYGRLHIETAGEQNNYNFIYCPNPNAYAKAIQDARVTFLKTYGG